MEASMSSLSSSVLLLDVLLEISAHSDPVTLVRCAATWKVLRREIANPAFHRRLRLRRADRFVPMFFRGFFVQNQHKKVIQPPRFSVPVRPSEPSPEPFRSFLLDNDSMLEFYHLELAASRGLVSLRSNTPESGGPPGTCVFNPMTGYVNGIPPPKINAQSFVLLTSDDGDGACHYRQLAAELASGRQDPGILAGRGQQSVAGHRRDRGDSVPSGRRALAPSSCPPRRHPLAVQVNRVPLHPEVLPRAASGDGDENRWELRRTATRTQTGGAPPGVGRPRRQPQLLVAIGLQISVWKLSDSGGGNGWSMQVLVEPERVHQNNVLSESLELRWFSEKSGYVFVRMAGANESSLSWYFMLQLATRRVLGLLWRAPECARLLSL
ncbi:hypothetical protein ZWY2020_013952 [Hordeum vulgare]|nr:hypothetical protein ZWY2020_013952 [Hordeum vulgare]